MSYGFNITDTSVVFGVAITGYAIGGKLGLGVGLLTIGVFFAISQALIDLNNDE